MKSKYRQPGWGWYHWTWYLNNSLGHRDYVDFIADTVSGYKTVYDAGCGDGVISFQVACRGAKVIGVDIDPVAIKNGRKMMKMLDMREPAVSLRVADAVTYHPGIMGAIVSSNNIEHVKNPEKMLHTFRTISNRLLISTGDRRWAKKCEYDVNVWTLKEFTTLLESNGWRIIKNHGAGEVIMLECSQ